MVIVAAGVTGDEIVESWTKTRRPSKWIVVPGMQCASVANTDADDHGQATVDRRCFGPQRQAGNIKALFSSH